MDHLLGLWSHAGSVLMHSKPWLIFARGLYVQDLKESQGTFLQEHYAKQTWSIFARGIYSGFGEQSKDQEVNSRRFG